MSQDLQHAIERWAFDALNDPDLSDRVGGALVEFRVRVKNGEVRVEVPKGWSHVARGEVAEHARDFLRNWGPPQIQVTATL